MEVRIVGGGEVVDALHQLLDAWERPTENGIISDPDDESLFLAEQEL